MAFNPPDVQISHSVNLSIYPSHLSIYLSFYFGSECRVPLLYETICHQRVGFTEELEHRNSSLSCPSEIVCFFFGSEQRKSSTRRSRSSFLYRVLSATDGECRRFLREKEMPKNGFLSSFVQDEDRVGRRLRIGERTSERETKRWKTETNEIRKSSG